MDFAVLMYIGYLPLVICEGLQYCQVLQEMTFASDDASVQSIGERYNIVQHLENYKVSWYYNLK